MRCRNLECGLQPVVLFCSCERKPLMHVKTMKSELIFFVFILKGWSVHKFYAKLPQISMQNCLKFLCEIASNFYTKLPQISMRNCLKCLWEIASNFYDEISMTKILIIQISMRNCLKFLSEIASNFYAKLHQISMRNHITNINDISYMILVLISLIIGIIYQ